MKIDVIARQWGTKAGAVNGMAMAASFFAATLSELGHTVRRIEGHDGFSADLIVSTVQPIWKRTAAAAVAAGAASRTVYWHHAGGLPNGQGCILAAPPAVSPEPSWLRHVVLPPSSWAAEAGGECTGDAIIVGGAGPAKGGHVARAVAWLCPDLRWYVLRGRSAPQDRAPWHAMANAEVAEEIVPQETWLSRARAVLAPTRFEVHPLLLVEAAVRGIPIVCTDMPSTRAAAGDGAFYVPMTAPPEAWANQLRLALMASPSKLRLRPYAEVVAEAIAQMTERAAA